MGGVGKEGEKEKETEDRTDAEPILQPGSQKQLWIGLIGWKEEGCKKGSSDEDRYGEGWKEEWERERLPQNHTSTN